jgi:hypothetical protein
MQYKLFVTDSSVIASAHPFACSFLVFTKRLRVWLVSTIIVQNKLLDTVDATMMFECSITDF